MRVVVTGATGNIGTSTLAALAADPRVTAITGIARRLPHREAPKTTWERADITDTDLVPLLRGADVLIHLAWLFQPTHRPPVTWDANAVGSARVFEAAARADVPALVYSSSVGAYSPGPKDRAVDESWPTHGWPGAAYSREKAYVERLLDAHQARHPDRRVVRIRPGFIFERQTAAQQRRLFAGPLLPGRLVRPGLIPLVPDLPGMRLQALHSADAGEAFALAALGDARGAFNIAADPVLDATELAGLLDARPVRLPARGVRAALAAAWALRLVPASPGLLDLALRVPVMDTARARDELGWTPRHTSREAIAEFLDGLRAGAGRDTPPLSPDTSGPARAHEISTALRRRP
ncbi:MULTISPECIES: NAD-dependent epimerase/dehydratase family protein [Actinomadura]|uniref:NAD-dependent epimerase/dehydratase family protein n=1 Tax=Actinomadura litoris TaxID=2678616 RepID=A0A7K1KZC1_9ACTN|nr:MULTISPECIES: NAD-dependent epimerase/dehydratase family protein [Actinomadura]MBT2211958.1 NAD-dependent epimerase/dehydratase family protein [Actinomadura sp. NEAU-AAG7]MUN37548.1 NAD-dependent epimerase/dehydratase family protein [Actinomadura litoris]